MKNTEHAKQTQFIIQPAGPLEQGTARRQLDRTDAEITGVARHCRFGYPVVVFHPPWHQGRIHPSLFWLACPWLVQLVDRFESTRCIKALERELLSDEVQAEIFQEEQEGFNAFLREETEKYDLPPAIAGRLRGLHVGGSARPLTVKCMHAHLAVTLAGAPTLAGRRTMNWLQQEYNLEMETVLTGEVNV